MILNVRFVVSQHLTSDGLHASKQFWSHGSSEEKDRTVASLRWQQGGDGPHCRVPRLRKKIFFLRQIHGNCNFFPWYLIEICLAFITRHASSLKPETAASINMTIQYKHDFLWPRPHIWTTCQRLLYKTVHQLDRDSAKPINSGLNMIFQYKPQWDKIRLWNDSCFISWILLQLTRSVALPSFSGHIHDLFWTLCSGSRWIISDPWRINET